jgi:hypothetical protein
MRVTVRDLPIILLVVVMLLLDALAVVRVADGQPGHVSQMNGILIYSLVLSQVWLVGMWAGVGRTRTAIRLPIAVGVLAGWGQLIHVLFVPQNVSLWDFHDWDALHFTLIAGFVAFAIGMSRISGSDHLMRVGEPTEHAGVAAAHRRFQFTLSEMLQVTAGCGASLAIMKFFYPPIEWFPTSVLGVHFAYVGVIVVSGAIASWAVLHTNFRVWRLGVLVLATWAMPFTFAVGRNQPWLITEVSIGVWPFLAFITSALFVGRVCGYRIVGKHSDWVALASEVGQCERDAATNSR